MYFFLTAGKNPGILGEEKTKQLEKIEITNYQLINEEIEKINIIEKVGNDNEVILTINDEEKKEIDLSNKETYDEDFPEKHYCNICKVVQGYRTRHCKRCEKCIRKFDHHCFWIGF